MISTQYSKKVYVNKACYISGNFTFSAERWVILGKKFGRMMGAAFSPQKWVMNSAKHSRLGLATTASSARLYTAKAGDRMECSRKASIHMRTRTADGHPKPLVVEEALVSKDLTNEVLMSWHDLICLGLLSSTFTAVDVAQVRKVELADGLREELMGNFHDVLSDFLSKNVSERGSDEHRL